MKKYGSKNANASVAKKTVRKMLNIPFWAYCVQISTTFLLSATEALVVPSSRIFALMNSTARYAPVVTACVDDRRVSRGGVHQGEYPARGDDQGLRGRQQESGGDLHAIRPEGDVQHLPDGLLCDARVRVLRAVLLHRL